MQKNDSFCASFCLYVLYLTQFIGFEIAVLNLYYQVCSMINYRNTKYEAQFKPISPKQPQSKRNKKYDKKTNDGHVYR